MKPKQKTIYQLAQMCKDVWKKKKKKKKRGDKNCLKWEI